MTKVRGGPDVFVVLCQDVSLLYSEVFLRGNHSLCYQKWVSLQESAAKVLVFCPNRQYWKCVICLRCQYQRQTLMLPFSPAFSLSSFKMFCRQLRHEWRLYTALATVISDEQTCICNISVYGSMVTVLIWRADSPQIPLSMYTLKVFLFRSTTDPPPGTTINFSLEPPLNNEFCPIYTLW